MGLIKAAFGAVGSTLSDQWKEYINCPDLGQDILMKKVTTKNGVISKDSIIQVNPGQIAIIVQSGKVLDATAESGPYTYDQSSSPSFFAGQFGEVFKEMWNRFTFGGATSKDQVVYYLNAKDIINNNFGTPAPVPFQDWSHIIPNQMTGEMTPLRVSVKCFGKYVFKISDPAVFMSKIAGTADEYRKEEIVEQMRAEVVASFQNVLNELGTSAHKTPVLELPSATDEIKTMMEEKVFDQPIRERGLSIVSFLVESVTLDEESNKKIDKYELSSNAYMQQGSLVGSYGEAVVEAAKNEGGAMNGFMGVGMMNMASGNAFGGAVNTIGQQIQNDQAMKAQQAAQQTAQQEVIENAPEAGVKFCGNCGKQANGGNYCTNCGTKLN